ncbi:MAG: hypothetical protein NZ518_09335, partial [Dehalococcoidia bacterium]|nr:hypothetical protein [Dehalococcoidia bacterium]
NLGRKEGPGAKGVDAITFWNANGKRVTLAWNNVGGGATTISIPAMSESATLYDKFGGNGRRITPQNGRYALSLPGATNNNNFGCVSGECMPEDYIIGGSTQVLVENTDATPAVTILPIGPGSEAPFRVAWRPVGRSGAGWRYDVQVMDTADGQWRDWQVNTTATSAIYGDRPEFPALFERTYLFRARARDASGAMVGMGYPNWGLASTTVLSPKPGATGAGGQPPSAITTPTATATPRPTRPTFYAPDPIFAAFYQSHDGPRILGRGLSVAFAPGNVGGKVQYFEKGRLEDHRATTTDRVWQFQYGLLVDELQQANARLPIGGDASTLTYADLAALASPTKRIAPPAGYTGNTLTRPDGSVFIPFTTDLRAGPGHTVPRWFWAYMNRADLFPGGWLHDIGLPITEPVEATVTKGSVTGRRIIVQAFQRTILTYDPANPPEWQVERANVGTDYLRAFPNRAP